MAKKRERPHEFMDFGGFWHEEFVPLKWRCIQVNWYEKVINDGIVVFEDDAKDFPAGVFMITHINTGNLYAVKFEARRTFSCRRPDHIVYQMVGVGGDDWEDLLQQLEEGAMMLFSIEGDKYGVQT